MKARNQSRTGEPSRGSRVVRRFAPLIILVAIGAGVAATYWANTRRPAPAPPSAAALSMARTAGPPAQTVIDFNSSNTLTLAGHEESTNDAVHLLNAGNQMLDQGNVEGAIATYLKAMKVNPEDEEVHFNLAFAFSKQGKYNEAIRFYTQALKIFPDYAEAHNNLGNVLVSIRRYEEAASHYSSALRINPESSSTLNNLGRCLAEMGKTSEAIVQFNEAIRVNPEYLEAYCNLGNAHLLQGNENQAVRQFQAALKINGSFLPAIKGLERVRARRASGGNSP